MFVVKFKAYFVYSPRFATFWIPIAITGTFPLMCLWNSVIILKHLWRNKHAIYPYNKLTVLFNHAACGHL